MATLIPVMKPLTPGEVRWSPMVWRMRAVR